MPTEEALETALDEIDHLVEELELPDEVTDFAETIVRRWGEMNRLESRPVVVNAAAAVVVACKFNNLPYTTRDVAAAVSEEVNPKYIGRAETDMISALELDIDVTTPEDYVERFADEAGLDEDAVERTKTVLEVAQEGDPNLFSGRSPSAGAAAAIWISARLGGEQVTQNTMSNIGETTSVTIRDMANSIILGVFKSDTDIEELSTTETIDGRLNQRIEKSKQQLEA